MLILYTFLSRLSHLPMFDQSLSSVHLIQEATIPTIAFSLEEVLKKERLLICHIFIILNFKSVYITEHNAHKLYGALNWT
jgi:hypothetical protein